MNLLNELIIILSVSALVLYVSTRLNLPSVVGLLIAGILVGPYSTGLISSIEAVDEMAEIGILLLLFSIGIEFSLEKLIESRKFVLIGGTMQVLLTLLVSSVIAFLLGLSLQQSIFVGMLFSMSSTAIVLQLFQEKGWTNTLFGRNTISILIFQDIIIIPMMLLAPYLAADGTMAENSLYDLALGILIVVVTVIAARRIVPPILRQIVHSRNQDLFLISVIVICFATAFVTYELGLKLALGAFLAGLIISESEYSFEALKNIKPFKKIFTAIFFISVGMLLNISYFLQNIMWIVGLTALAIVIKTLLVFFISMRLNLGMQHALVSGLALSQVGEFAFILSKVGIDMSLITEETYQLFLAISILSMIVTAIVINRAPYIASRLIRQRPFSVWFPLESNQHCLPMPCHLQNHVLIIGFGPGGKRIAESLLTEGNDLAIVDSNENNFTPEFDGRVEEFVGDATDREILERAGVENARQIIITIPEAAVAEDITRKVRKMNATARIIVRSKYESEIAELERLGADHVIPEELTVAEIIRRTSLSNS